jgi:ADP-ribose pyrophosphatase YjhB (NUDIX family)
MVSTVCDLGVAARAIENNSILLVKEGKGRYQNLWSLPKGSVGEGEVPELAVIRELLEETGAEGTIIGLAAVRSTLSDSKPAIFLCYDVHVTSSISNVANDEISEMGWFRLDELKSLDWVSETMHNLSIDALSGTRKSIQPSCPLSKESSSYFVYNVNQNSEYVI